MTLSAVSTVAFYCSDANTLMGMIKVGLCLKVVVIYLRLWRKCWASFFRFPHTVFWRHIQVDSTCVMHFLGVLGQHVGIYVMLP
jgi:hypothetical protein